MKKVKLIALETLFKQMVGCFFLRKNCYVAAVLLGERQTINSEWFTLVYDPEFVNPNYSVKEGKQIGAVGSFVIRTMPTVTQAV